MLNFDPKPIQVLKPFRFPAQRVDSLPAVEDEEVITDWRFFADFIRSKGSVGMMEYKRWIDENRKIPDEILRAFKGHKHKALFSQSVSEIDKVIRRSPHSLGDLQASCQHYKGVSNWSPITPFMFVFHLGLEALGRVPTWPEALDFLINIYPEYCWIPFCKSHDINHSIGMDGLRVHDLELANAFQWRLGCVYYSFVREVHFLASMRQIHKIDLLYHFAIDAEWRADYISGNVLVELFIVNTRYKSRDRGRKKLCRDVNPEREVVEITIEQTSVRRGVPYIVPPRDLSIAATQLRAAGCLEL